MTRLTAEEFAEETINVLDGDSFGAAGLHTFSGVGGRAVIDVCRPRFTPWRIPGVLQHKWRHLRGK